LLDTFGTCGEIGTQGAPVLGASVTLVRSMDIFLGQHHPECDKGYGDAENEGLRKLGEQLHTGLLQTATVLQAVIRMGTQRSGREDYSMGAAHSNRVESVSLRRFCVCLTLSSGSISLRALFHRYTAAICAVTALLGSVRASLRISSLGQ